MRKTLLLLALLSSTAHATPEQTAAAALKEAPVWDGHNDVPEQLRNRRHNLLAGFDFHNTTAEPGEDNWAGDAKTPTKKDPMQTDLPRLRKGGVGAQFWSVFVSPALPEPQAVQATIEQVDVMKRLIAANPTDLAYCEDSACVERAWKSGKIASLLGAEGGHSIGGSLAVLRQLYAIGVRYMTLTHFKNNAWADSGTDAPAHNGLTPFGRDVVREMQRLGMLVDLSHVSQKTMLDAIAIAKAPVIFSHSGSMAVSGHPRNVSDEVLDAVKPNGGVVMVNFYPAYVSEALYQWNAARSGEDTRQKALHPDRPDLAKAAMAEWVKAHPKPTVTVKDVADHIDHIRARIGIDHIGLGSDFDGGSVGIVGLEDTAAYPNLFIELARRGYTKDELKKIASGNIMRALKAAESSSAAHKADLPIENPTSF
jgi:membrane dipeptidase